MTSAAEVRLKKEDAPMNVPNSTRAKNVSSQGFRIPQSPSESPQFHHVEQNGLFLLSLA